MFSQMRLQLQAHRAWLNAPLELKGRIPGKVAVPARAVLELATIGGAVALGMDDRTGSLTPGKDADIAVISCRDINTTPMVDPAGMVIFYANPSNVDTVLVAGRAIKRNGVLVDIDWPALRAQLMKSHEHVMSCAQRIPLEKIQNLWTSTWYYDIASMILPEKAKQRQMRSLA
jgi:5-methylthioadenosine/S-adenosylhomocysteine deaminase